VQRLADAQLEYSSGRLDRWAAPPDEPRGPARGTDGGEAPDRVASGYPVAVERALAAMRGPLDQPLSLATLAEIAGLSPFHFARTFRQATGSPPGQFLAALRLERAKRLLLTTDLPVTEICFAVGYDSLGTFTTRFTQLVGLPPSRVRRLPDLLTEAVARLPGDGLAPVRADAAPGVTGRVAPSAGADGLIFVGLFTGAIAQGRPVAGTVLAGPGPFRLPAPPDGRYHLLAAALPHPRDPLACLLPGAALRVGRAAGTLLARGGRVSGPTDIALRPPQATDPPTLVALPALLLNFCPRFRAARAAGA
jgi:AraC family transcriptional regulator